jgi:hypothetical protein
VGKSLNGRQGAKSRTESENGYLSIPTFNLKLGSFSYFYSKNKTKKKKTMRKRNFCCCWCVSLSISFEGFGLFLQQF